MSPTNKSDPGEGCSDFRNVYEQSQLPRQDDFAWGNDDAFLHFDQHLRDQNSHRTTYITEDKLIYSDESNIRQDIHGKRRTRKLSDHLDASSSTKKKQKGKSTKLKGKQKAGYDPLLDKEWEAKLKESIIQDNELHLRILRYEVCYMLVQIDLC